MPSERGSRAALAFLGGLLLTSAITIATGLNLIATSLGVLGSLGLGVRELVTGEKKGSYSKWVWFTAAMALAVLTAIPILAAYSPAALSQPTSVSGGGAPSSSQVTCSNPCVNGVWDSGILNPGQSFSFTFNKPGVYNYICNVHPMSGTIVVVG